MEKREILVDGKVVKMDKKDIQTMFVNLIHSEHKGYICFPESEVISDSEQKKWRQGPTHWVKYDASFGRDDLPDSLNRLCNHYLTINTYGDMKRNNTIARTKANVSNINGFLIDIDYHEECSYGVREEMINEIDSFLQELIKKSKLPCPNTYVLSGRGVGMLYLFKDFELSEELKVYHEACAKKVGCAIQEMIPLDNVDVDMNVFELTRCTRMPETYHQITGKISRLVFINTKKYDPEELYNYFKIDKITITKDSASKVSFSDEKDINRAKYQPEQYTKYFAHKNYMKKAIFYVKAMNQMVKDGQRRFVDGFGRKKFLFVYYNYNLISRCDRFASQDATKRMNGKFEEPVSEKELEDIFLGVDTHKSRNEKYSDFLYVIPAKSAIKLLRLTDEDARYYGFTKSKGFVDCADKRNREICQLALETDLKICEIVTFYNESRPANEAVSQSTVEKVLRKFGINRNTRKTLKLSDLDFEVNMPWKRKKADQ